MDDDHSCRHRTISQDRHTSTQNLRQDCELVCSVVNVVVVHVYLGFVAVADRIPVQHVRHHVNMLACKHDAARIRNGGVW